MSLTAHPGKQLFFRLPTASLVPSATRQDTAGRNQGPIQARYAIGCFIDSGIKYSITGCNEHG